MVIGITAQQVQSILNVDLAQQMIVIQVKMVNIILKLWNVILMFPLPDQTVLTSVVLMVRIYIVKMVMLLLVRVEVVCKKIVVFQAKVIIILLLCNVVHLVQFMIINLFGIYPNIHNYCLIIFYLWLNDFMFLWFI